MTQNTEALHASLTIEHTGKAGPGTPRRDPGPQGETLGRDPKAGSRTRDPESGPRHKGPRNRDPGTRDPDNQDPRTGSPTTETCDPDPQSQQHDP